LSGEREGGATCFISAQASGFHCACIAMDKSVSIDSIVRVRIGRDRPSVRYAGGHVRGGESWGLSVVVRPSVPLHTVLRATCTVVSAEVHAHGAGDATARVLGAATNRLGPECTTQMEHACAPLQYMLHKRRSSARRGRGRVAQPGGRPGARCMRSGGDFLVLVACTHVCTPDA
jgi:hypothetical protein